MVPEKNNMENDEIKKSSELQESDKSLTDEAQVKETSQSSGEANEKDVSVSDTNEKSKEKETKNEEENISESAVSDETKKNSSEEEKKDKQDETISEQVNEVIEDVKEKAEAVASQVSQIIQDVKEKVTSDEEEKKESLADLSKPELVERLKSLIDEPVTTVKKQVDAVKQFFYKKSKLETEEQRNAYIEEGGDEKDFIPKPTEFETEFKELLNQYREKRARYIAEQEREKEQNLLKKRHIIEQISKLVETKEDVSSNINVFKQLQQDWKAIGAVPASANNDLWQEYNQQQEAFWDLIKINNELREYDFKKNLEAKTKLCEMAEELDKEENVISAFKELQMLHDKWRELGPVSRELREDLWQRFKAASTVINKKHQEHFNKIRESELENLAKKEKLCEQIEAINTDELTNYKSWDDATKQVLEMQEEWRSIGYTPRKHNQKIFERYRKACDNFFDAKAEFYKSIKVELNKNLEKKLELCEKAESLKSSTDWKSTTDKFIKLQKEWKTIGPVPRKQSDEVWKRFITACDSFFDARNKEQYSHKQEEQENLEKKKELIKKIENFEKQEDNKESLKALRALTAEWNSIGHVPFKEKDEIYKTYKKALDEQFDSLNIDISQRRLESFKSNLGDIEEKGENKLYREREKLMRAYSNLKNEITTYENNIGFFNVSSKKGSSVLAEMEQKIQALKNEAELIEKKINLIDEKI